MDPETSSTNTYSRGGMASGRTRAGGSRVARNHPSPSSPGKSSTPDSTASPASRQRSTTSLFPPSSPFTATSALRGDRHETASACDGDDSSFTGMADSRWAENPNLYGAGCPSVSVGLAIHSSSPSRSP